MKLTEREFEVYQLILKGYTNDEIAKTLYLAPCTVKAHTQKVLAKAGVENRVQLLAQELQTATQKLESIAKEYGFGSR